MAETSRIEWTDATWNPVAGCTKVSAGCRNCYAVRNAWRMERHPNAKIRERYSDLAYLSDRGLEWMGKARCLEDQLEIPMHWLKPKRVFVCSLSDLFHEDVPFDFLDDVFWTMERADWHTFQVLTKRPRRMLAYVQRRLPLDMLHRAWPGNIWAGTTVENEDADFRLLYLRQVPAGVRFLSCEPLLSRLPRLNLSGISQVIVGAESGPNARLMEEDWAREIRDQCQAAGVAFFYKQAWQDGRLVKMPLLDGRQWAQMPGVER